ncbi:MAG: chloride channel protein [Pseudomonadota bacterium]
MTVSSRRFIKKKIVSARMAARRAWDVLLEKGPSQFQFWLIALFIGIAAGFAASLFRMAVNELQRWAYGTDNVALLHSFAQTLPWYWILLVPICGGLAVGLILHFFTPDGRARSVADVIEGAALGDGRVETKAGVASVFASIITLGTGGSSGREGPVVHMAGLISTWVSDRIKASGLTSRDLLGCAVAAAVSASFNAPIAGALFALEVVLRHFALHAFAPITIAAVSGAVIARWHFGDMAEFALPVANILEFYVELPAFLLLGLTCGLVASALMYAVFFAEDAGNLLQERLRLPRWLRPVVAGAMLGGIAIWFPHIIGVGYDTTLAALNGSLLLHEAIVFTVLKVLAVAITLGGRMGGGVFSPSLMVGALVGLAFGIVATSLFPEYSGSANVYALAGMGAVSASVIGAPISTTLIVFELTGDWQIGIAVMVAVSMSSALSANLVTRSFFLMQLERRGVRLAAGPHAYVLSMMRVQRVMRAKDDPRAAPEDDCWQMIEDGIYVDAGATLEVAMTIFDRTSAQFLPVVQIPGEGAPPELLGAVFHVDALRRYNRALAEISQEEHS